MKCEECKYFEATVGDNNETLSGECRKRTPFLRAFVLSDDDKDRDGDGEPLGREGIWPEVQTYDWCGEFEAKEV